MASLNDLWVKWLSRGLSSTAGVGSGSDAVATETDSIQNLSLEYLYNGTTFDRRRANTEKTVLVSAARTATVSSADLTNHNARGVHVIIDVTLDPALASVTFTVEGKDPVSGVYYTILTSAAIIATGTTALTVYPGVTETANVKESDVIPRTWRVTATHVDADSITYSVGATEIV